MSDTEGMVRLMEHTADRLEAAVRTIQSHASRSWGINEQGIFAQILAAMALAEGVLRMVACSAAAGASPVDQAIEALADYTTWAAQHDDAAVLDLAELASVERYFRAMTPVTS